MTRTKAALLAVLLLTSSLTTASGEQSWDFERPQNRAGRHAFQCGISVASGIHLGYKYNVTNWLAPRVSLGWISLGRGSRFGYASGGVDCFLINDADGTLLLSLLASSISSSAEDDTPVTLVSLMLGKEAFLTDWLSARFGLGFGDYSNPDRDASDGLILVLDTGLNLYLDGGN